MSFHICLFSGMKSWMCSGANICVITVDGVVCVLNVFLI